MASTPDHTPPPTGNASQPINDRAAQLNAELEELRAKIAKLMRDSQDLLGELDGPKSAGDSA
jgi:hypothetical protein